MTNDQQIAQTILEQLTAGGTNRLNVMIGAKNFAAIKNGLAFQFKGSRKYNGINIVLAADDTYSVRLVKIGNLKVTRDETTPDIYAENLSEFFEEETGLRLSL